MYYMSAYLQSLGDYPGTVLVGIGFVALLFILAARKANVRCARKREPVYTDPYSPHLLPRPSVDREIKAAFGVKAKPVMPVRLEADRNRCDMETLHGPYFCPSLGKEHLWTEPDKDGLQHCQQCHVERLPHSTITHPDGEVTPLTDRDGAEAIVKLASHPASTGSTAKAIPLTQPVTIASLMAASQYKPKGHIKKSLGKSKKHLRNKSRHTPHSPSCSSKQHASRHPKASAWPD